MRHNELKWVSHINTKYTKRFAAYLYSESLLEIMFSVLVLVLVVVVRNIAAYILRSILSVRVGQVAVTTSWGRSGQLTLALIHSASTVFENPRWVDFVDAHVPTGWGGLILMYCQSVNVGIHSAWGKASDRTLWRHIVDTVTLHHAARSRKRRENRH